MVDHGVEWHRAGIDLHGWVSEMQLIENLLACVDRESPKSPLDTTLKPKASVTRNVPCSSSFRTWAFVCSVVNERSSRYHIPNYPWNDTIGEPWTNIQKLRFTGLESSPTWWSWHRGPLESYIRSEWRVWTIFPDWDWIHQRYVCWNRCSAANFFTRQSASRNVFSQVSWH